MVAEQSQLIRPLGRTVLSMVCAALAALPAHTLQIGVNVSPVELSDEGWVDGVLGIVDQWGVDPCCLVFELTESAVQSARRPIQADLMRLRKRGVGIFLSNFGTGSSSLAMLRDLPVTGLKLDASLVATVDRPGSFGAALAKGIIEVVRPLGLAGVAEGVETEGQAASLAEIGWEFGQGYLFAHPGSLNSVSPVPARLLGVLPR
ncbi:MAG: EAL domain-containing protein [Actinobacteria bacterium]|nr:EAL domain-containing protein [Actinomycetota bacterium]